MFALGRVLMMQGRLDDAIAVDDEGAASLRAAGELVLRSMILASLGWSLVMSQRLERARDVLEEALGIVTAMQNRDGIARTLDALAAVSLHRREPRPSALLLGAAEGVRRSVGGCLWVIDRLLVGYLEADLRRALGNDEFERAFEEGVALPTERAIDLARAAAAARVGAVTRRGVTPSGSAGRRRGSERRRGGAGPTSIVRGDPTSHG